MFFLPIVNGTFWSDPWYEYSVGAIDSISLTNVQSQCLSWSFDNFNKTCHGIGILKNKRKKKHFLKKGEKNIRNLDSFHEISEKKQWKRIFQNGPLAEVKKALKKKAIEIRICEYWGERERKKPELPTKKARKWTLMEYMNHWRAGEEQCLENH